MKHLFKILSVTVALCIILTALPISVSAAVVTQGATSASTSYPSAVSNFKGTALSENSIKLTWNVVSGAKGYIIYRYNNTAKKYEKIATATGTAYTNSNLSAGTSYKYAIRAYKTVSGSNILSKSYPQITILTPPAVVSGVSAVASVNKIDLKWSKAAGAKGYYVYRYNFSTNKYSRIAKITSLTYTDSGLSAATKYRYAVRAYITSGSTDVLSLKYNPIDTTTLPPVVTNLKASSSSNKITLTWNKISGITGYYVYSYNFSTKKYSNVAKQTSNTYTFSNASTGTDYKFAVRAYKTVDGKNILSPSYPQVEVSTGLAAVKNIKASATADKIKLTWDKVTSAAGYYVYRYDFTTGKYSKISKQTALNYTDSNLKIGTGYRYAIRAYKNSDSKEILSSTYTHFDVSTIVPTVTNLKTSASDSKITLKWDAINDVVGYYIYKYDFSTNKFSKIAKQSANTYTLSGVASGTKFRFAVRAYVVSDGKEVLSISYPQIDVTTTPAIVKNIKADVSSDKVKLSWDKADGATGYVIYRYDYSSNTYTSIAKIKALSYLDQNLSVGTTYKYAIRAYTSTGSNDILSTAYLEFEVSTLPDSVTKVKSSSASDKITLTWDAAEGATAYYVYRYNFMTQKYEKISNQTGLTYTDSNLSSGTEYRYAVRAYAVSSGREVLSETYPQIDVSTNPSRVDYNLSIVGNKVSLSWAPVTGATGYKVYCRLDTDDKWTLLADTKDTSFTKTGLERGRTYIFTVKSYKVYNGHTYNGDYEVKGIVTS